MSLATGPMPFSNGAFAQVQQQSLKIYRRYQVTSDESLEQILSTSRMHSQLRMILEEGQVCPVERLWPILPAFSSHCKIIITNKQKNSSRS